MNSRVTVIHNLPQTVSSRFKHFEAAIRIIVAEVGSEHQPVVVAALSVIHIGDIERAEHTATNTRIRKQMMRRWVHYVAMIPGSIQLTAHALGIFHTPGVLRRRLEA